MKIHAFIIRNSQGVFERLDLSCPACALPLYRSIGRGPTFVYCPHGACVSQACNDGATARDIETARDLIQLNFDKENLGADLTPSDPNFENTVEAFLMRD